VKTLLSLTAVAAMAVTIAAAESPATPASFFDFTMKTVDGVEQPLSAWKGKALLVVNTASKCGYTPQYAGLEELYQKYRDRGFVVLAFPANDFLWQEPGTDPEIKQFCTSKYHVTFPIFSKISVKGSDMAPLYRWLTTQEGFSGAITWNFNKFLIGPDGRIVARFGSRVAPMSPELTSKLETILPKK
jgi:glutathione peroxidase